MSLNQPSYDSGSSVAASGFDCASCAEAPGVARVTLSGELDIATAPHLGDALSDAARGSTVVILDPKPKNSRRSGQPDRNQLGARDFRAAGVDTNPFAGRSLRGAEETRPARRARRGQAPLRASERA
jgi:hypothetical protein